MTGEHGCQDDLPTSRVDFPGPFAQHDVVVDGWRVPLLHAHPTAEDRVMLVLDNRLATELSLEEAERVVPFLADAIAVALGYPSHPKGGTAPPRSPHPRPVRTMDIAQFEPGAEEAA